MICFRGQLISFHVYLQDIHAFYQNAQSTWVDCGHMEYEDVYCSMNSIISYFDNFNDNNRSFRLNRLFKNTFGFEYNDLSTFRRRDFYNV